MRPAYRAGTRGWLLLPVAALVLSGLAAGCSSSKPAYCTAATDLKTSVSNLSNVDVANRPQLPADRAEQRPDQRENVPPATRSPRIRRRPQPCKTRCPAWETRSSPRRASLR